MKKTLLTLLAGVLSLGLAQAQEKPAYVLFDAEGRTVDYATMIRSLAQDDVVFIGEIHDCAIAHWMEYEIVRSLYEANGEQLMVGAEMFERDDQLVLDEYLAGIISADRFNHEAKLWPNYKTDYAPIVEFAKEHKIPFVATNIPRRYANVVAHGGFEALDTLTDEARGYIAPLPLDYVPNELVDRYFGAMMMPGMKASQAENLSRAQAMKDATMGWSISLSLTPGRKMVHLNGNFHSMGYAGILTYLNQYRPGLKIGTVEVVRQANTDRVDEKNMGHADFYICVPETMTRTF